jgi:hypothetical protein
LKKAGVTKYVKVIVDMTNEDIMKKYGVTVDTLVICAPNGDGLQKYAGEQCKQTPVGAGLKFLPAQLAAWKVSFDKKATDKKAVANKK